MEKSPVNYTVICPRCNVVLKQDDPLDFQSFIVYYACINCRAEAAREREARDELSDDP